MFAELARCWLPATFSSSLKGRTPQAVTLAGVPLVLFRGEDGRAAALLDRCPHRGVALSKGQVEEGLLVCPFHGWAFDGQGTCRKVPLNPDARKDKLSGVPLPVVEAGGLVWVFTEAGTLQGEGMPVVPPSLEDPTVQRRELVSPWAAHWTRAMENMLDVPHLPYVHRRTIGRDVARLGDLDQVGLTFELTDTDDGFELAWAFDGAPDPATLSWHKPAGMVLRIPTPVGVLTQHIFCVPAEPGRTRMMLVSTSKKPWWARLIPATLFEGFEDRILLEDQHIVETSPPGSVAEAEGERSVATDKPTLRFRAWYRSHGRSATA